MRGGLSLGFVIHYETAVILDFTLNILLIRDFLGKTLQTSFVVIDGVCSII